MKKIKEIREIKSKIKSVKEINQNETEGDKEIEELTSDEIPLRESETETFSPGSISISGGGRLAVEPILAEPERPRARVQEEQPTGQLYDVGRNMGGAAGEERYKPVDTIQAAGLRQLDVGKDFAMGSGGGSYPEAQEVESKLRGGAEMEHQKYEAERMEGSGGNRARRKYPWEV